MSYSYYYFDDQTVGADDLNKLVNMFVTGGVADSFENGVPYSVSALNGVVYSNATEGIVPESADTLKVSVSGGYVYIEKGVAFFGDGTVISIDSREAIKFTKGTKNYVYLKSSKAENKAYPVVSASAPSGDYFVLLATVEADGTVKDERRYAKGKVPSFYASDAGLKVEREIAFDVGTDKFDTDNKVTLVDSGNSYRYLMIVCEKETDTGYGWVGTSLYDKAKDVSFSFSRPGNGNYTDDHTEISTGGAFTLCECWSGTTINRIYGQLFIDDDGKTELKITTNKTGTTESRFNQFVFPFKIKVIAY